MDAALNFFFFWMHVIIILFNLLGWIWEKTRRIHLIVVAITVFSWLILGMKYGLGYCWLTDWHWQIKRKLGETNLPASFIKYFIDGYTPLSISAITVDIITGVSFALAVVLTIYFNLIKIRKK